MSETPVGVNLYLLLWAMVMAYASYCWREARKEGVYLRG